MAAALGGNTGLTWVSDNDFHIAHLLAQRFSDLPNIGVLTDVC